MSSRTSVSTTGTEVTPQAVIVVNAVRDSRGALKRRRDSMREPSLYPGGNEDENLTITPGFVLRVYSLRS